MTISFEQAKAICEQSNIDTDILVMVCQRNEIDQSQPIDTSHLANCAMARGEIDTDHYCNSPAWFYTNGERREMLRRAVQCKTLANTLNRLYNTTVQLGRTASPYERTRAAVHATGNRWSIENFHATHD